jgi:hypothetical protein
VGPKAGLDAVEKRKFLPLQGIVPRLLSRPAPSPSLYRLTHTHTHTHTQVVHHFGDSLENTPEPCLVADFGGTDFQPLSYNITEFVT